MIWVVDTVGNVMEPVNPLMHLKNIVSMPMHVRSLTKRVCLCPDTWGCDPKHLKRLSPLKGSLLTQIKTQESILAELMQEKRLNSYPYHPKCNRLPLNYGFLSFYLFSQMWHFLKRVWLCFKPWLNYYPSKNSVHFYMVLSNKNIQPWRTSMIQRQRQPGKIGGNYCNTISFLHQMHPSFQLSLE